MLRQCTVNKDVVTNMKRGQMPSADKLIAIAQYLEVSAEYLMGVTDDPTPPKKELTLDEQIAAKYYTLSSIEREQLNEYLAFLKIKRDFKNKLTNGQTETALELQPE